MAHIYDSPELPKELENAVSAYAVLSEHLDRIQQLTGIPALDSPGQKIPGVLERIQAKHDEGETSLEGFRLFDLG